jgi:hypothetical protein
MDYVAEDAYRERRGGVKAMAVVLSEDVQALPAPRTVTTTTETLVVAGFELPLTSDHAKAVIRGWVDLTIPAGTTAINLRIYIGAAVGGRLLAAKQAAATDFTVGATQHFVIEAIDVHQNAGAAAYCMSVKLTGATANGTVAAGLIHTTLLTG